ncbi:MAG: ferredoxin [Nanoarchaeota archaeon]|nr:ferredoxin [Nanoarchaeota archaeon]
MAKYKIIFDRDACIGAAACLVSKNWKIADDGKANPAVVEFDDEAMLKQEMEAAEACPVNAIHIEENNSKKRLI